MSKAQNLTPNVRLSTGREVCLRVGFGSWDVASEVELTRDEFQEIRAFMKGAAPVGLHLLSHPTDTDA